MENHLIIGLGGTGGKIIRSLRKTIYQDYRSNDPDDVNIGYLYMDTSNEMMQIDDSSWKVLGTSVQLQRGSMVYIEPGQLIQVIKNIKQYPGIKDWIGDVTDWSEYLNAQAGLNTAGGQRRRLGRFILASNVTAFEEALRTQVATLQRKSGTVDVHFHICCGLAGGTGAGTILDILALVRKNFSPSSVAKFKIIPYLFLPEEHPKANRDSGFYHSNGYAALCEINAYGVGAMMPIDLSTSNTNKDARFTKIEDPFNGAYLFSNINENGNRVDVDIEVPNIIADFLFQKIISIKDMIWKRDKLGKQENMENLDAAAEQTSTSLLPERSIRFLTFGVKRIAIPEEEIREFITYNYARQAILQLRYNNWTDETGFRDEAVNQNFNELVGNKKTHESWRTTDEHFQLSIPIIEDAVTARWRKIGDTWRFVIPQYKITAKEKKDANWLDELKKLCDRQFLEQYRNMGVQKFYEAKVDDRRDLAREIVSRIEKELFAEWQNATKSLFDIKRLLDTLTENLQKRFAGIDDKIIKSQEHEDDRLRIIKENEKTWADVGIVSGWLGKKDKLLDAQATAFEEFYIYKTQVAGLKFSKVLISETIEQLNGLKSQVDTANQKLHDSLREFDTNINARCNDDISKMNSEESYKQQVIRFYDPDKVKIITKHFIKDKKEQDTQTSNVRKALISHLGENPNFLQFNERISRSTFINELEKTCDQNAKIAEASLDAKDRLFDVGIVGKLKERYDGNYEDLRLYVKKLVDYSGCFITFDQNEINKSGDGIHPLPIKIKTFTIVIPHSPEHQDFVNELERAFKDMTPAGITAEFVYTKSKKFEIVLLSLINGFPLRFVSLVHILRRKYEERISKEDSARAKMFLHTEGDGSNLPRLFVPSQKEIEAELEQVRLNAIPLIILGYAFGLIVETEDPNGYSKLAFVEKNEFGKFKALFFMDKKISDSHKKFDHKTFELLENVVLPLFDNNYKHKEKKEELTNSILKIVGETIYAERGSKDNDPIYQLYEAEASKIITKLKA